MAEYILTENEFNKDNIAWNGNRFLIGNGYFGIRGTLEEYTKKQMCAVNMAGIYDRAGNSWRESVNAPNPIYTYVKVNGKTYALPNEKPKFHQQELDFRYGLHCRVTRWQTKHGNITVICERFASIARQHNIAMKYTFSADFDCEAEIITGIDGDVWDINGPHFVKMQMGSKDGIDYVTGITGEKNISVTTKEYIRTDFQSEQTTRNTDKSIFRHIKFTAKADKEYTFEKIAEITTSVDDFGINGRIDELSYRELNAEHKAEWDKIWDISQIHIDGDDEAEYALNYSIYHLNCIAPRNMKGKSIPARGLSGQVYKGAVFWDTEMFMIDYYIHTAPEVAKTLLQYRIDTLDGARTKAKSYGFDGAFYAWESQEGGYDACSDYNVVDVFTKRPMRTFFKDKQVHISAAVVYALDKYVKITGDTSVLDEGGCDVIRECAKFYRSLLLKRLDGDTYEIHDVIGPDEYHERVNNNAYTNAMARFVFRTAAKYLNDQEYADLTEKIYMPRCKDGVIEQFDGYFDLEDCSIDEVRGRLLDPKEYWGGAYGVASHTQVIKQADVVAMLAMLPEEFSDETKRANLKFYEPRTEHGSSLSACMYSMLSCKTGDAEFAYPFFMKSAEADLHSGGKEWAGLVYIGGTHPASAGGAWMVAVFGFAGLEIKDGEITCKPRLPKAWKGMNFKINYKGSVYKIEINGSDWSVTRI